MTYLLEKSPELVNKQTFYKLNTPLHLAIQEQWDGMVKILLKAGSDVTIRNNDS